MAWNVGNTALCVKVGPLGYQNQDSKGLPALRLKGKYLVNNVHTCSCGSVSLDIGLVIREGLVLGVRCGCGAVSAPSDIHWCASERFVNEQDIEAEATEEQLEEAIKSEDYVLAASIRDKLNK